MAYFKNAYTMMEIVMVITVISILMLWMTAYFWWSQDRWKIIEAQWCAGAFLWEMNNYIYYALTSKSLKVSDKMINPNIYTIELSWNNNGVYRSVLLRYDENWLYKKLDSGQVCRNNSQVWFYWSWDDKKISMKKWFIQTTPTDKVFSVGNNLTWSIIVVYCTNKECSWSKDIARLNVDGRSQTIYIDQCKLYKDSESNKCQTWESEE